MNIVKSIDQYNEHNIYFCEPIKNNIMNDGTFIRILYSNHKVVLNGVYLYFTLNEITCDKFYNKYKCMFNPNNHKELIDKLKTIEDGLLRKINIKNKIPQNKIFEQFKNGNIKIFNNIIDNKSEFILKISGIWETYNNYGLTYKFVNI